MSFIPKGTILKNTFLESDDPNPPVRRVQTMGSYRMDEELALGSIQETLMTIVEPPTSSEESPEEGSWTVAWISQDAFRDTQGKEALLLASNMGHVKCYKSVEKFFRTFSKKVAARPDTCGKQVIVVIEEEAMDTLQNLMPSLNITRSTFKAVLNYTELSTVLPQLISLTSAN